METTGIDKPLASLRRPVKPLPLIGPGWLIPGVGAPVSARPIFSADPAESTSFRRGLIAGAELGDVITKLLAFRGSFEVLVLRSIAGRVEMAARLMSRTVELVETTVAEDREGDYIKARFERKTPLAVPVPGPSRPPGACDAPARHTAGADGRGDGITIANFGARKPQRVGKCLMPSTFGRSSESRPVLMGESIYIEFEQAKGYTHPFVLFLNPDDAARVASEILAHLGIVQGGESGAETQ